MGTSLRLLQPEPELVSTSKIQIILTLAASPLIIAASPLINMSWIAIIALIGLRRKESLRKNTLSSPASKLKNTTNKTKTMHLNTRKETYKILIFKILLLGKTTGISTTWIWEGGREEGQIHNNFINPNRILTTPLLRKEKSQEDSTKLQFRLREKMGNQEWGGKSFSRIPI